MPCCHVGPAGPFAAQFKTDAQRFSAYVGGSPNLPPGAVGPELVSALHVDLKLWQPGPNRVPLGRPYRINDAFGNAWKTARPQLSPDPFKGHPADRAFIKSVVLNLPPQPSGCVLSVFDQWILDTIIAIRDRSLRLAGGNAPSLPYALSTVGMAQKILNVYLKYQACWHMGGQWDQATGQFVNHPASASIAPFLCALHCPIDREIIIELLKLPIGKWCLKKGLMDEGGKLRQANGSLRRRSQFDCWHNYYGFQFMLRKIVIQTWPSGCMCNCISFEESAINLVNKIPKTEGFNQEFDWIREVESLPKEVIDETITAIGKQETCWKVDRNGVVGSADSKIASRLFKKRVIQVDKQGSYLALKWVCGKYNKNAGAISFDRPDFSGPCHVNSKISHAGGDLSLWEQIRSNGFEFFGPDFSPSRTGAVEGYGGGNGYIGYRTFGNERDARRYLWQTGFIVRDCASDCSQYWGFVDWLAEFLKLVRYLQQSDILVFKKEPGKPKKWLEYLSSKKLNGKERENSGDSKNDGVGILDLLGTYSPFETTIRIYPEAIQECADDLGINQTDLTHVVILHELGHAFVHLGSSGNAVVSAYDLVECNRFWVQLEFFGRSAIHEFLAQSFTWIAVNDLAIREIHPNLSGLFSKLVQSQPEDYKLWGRHNRPNDEQAWQAWLNRARGALNEPAHWENCLRQIRHQMPANLDVAIKLFIKPDDSRPALVSRLFSKI
jgi:hypothetical protein